MKKILITLMCIAMVIAMMPAMAFAEEAATVLEVGEGKTYATLNEAKDSDIAVAAGGNIVYRIYGSVTLETLFSHGDWSLGTIEGATSDAKLTIIGGGVTDIVNTTLRNLTFADEGEYLPTANEFMYQNFETCTFENVIFEGSPRLSGECTVTDCAFKNDTENKYGLWLDEGEFTITGSDFEISDNAYGMVKSDATGSTLLLENNTFVNKSSSEKEALNTKGLVITAEGNTFTNFKGGILPTDKTNEVNGETATGADADSVIEATNTVNPYAAAKIGETGYESLQAALDAAAAAPGDYEIVLVSGIISENVVVDQKEGVNITIKGNQEDTVFTGTIVIDGNSRYDGAETLTIDGVVFKTTNTTHEFILQNEAIDGEVRYPHNVTVKNCTFSGPGKGSNAVAMKIRQGFNIKVEDCTATNMHSLMQAYGCAGVTIDTVTITESGRGISLGTSTDVVIKNANIDVDKYGIRLDASSATSMTVEDSAIKAFIPVVVRYATGKVDLAFNGNNNMTGLNEGDFWCAVADDEFEDGKTTPPPATGDVEIRVNDTALPIEGIYGVEKEKIINPSIGGGILVDRVAAEEEAGVCFEALDVQVGDTVKVELYAGAEKLVTKELLIKDNMGSGTKTCTFYTVGASSSWTQTPSPWTAYDCKMPTHADLYINEIYINSDDVDFKAQEWAAFAGTNAHVYTNGTCTICGSPDPNYVPPTTPTYTPSVTIQKPVIESAENATVTLGVLGTTATITPDEGFEIVDVTVNGVSKGDVTTISGLKTGDKIVVITKAINAEAPDSEEPMSGAELIQEKLNGMQLVARSKRTTAPSGKSSIMVYWYDKAGAELDFDGVEIYRSTKKGSGYKKVFTSKTDQYYNTAIEKGVKYYYKVRGYVEVDGEKLYTGWSLKAIRTAK